MAEGNRGWIVKRMVRCCGSCLVAGFLTTCAMAAEEERSLSSTNAPEAAEIRVLDVVVTHPDRVRVGTNSMSLAAATNFVAANMEAIDVVAVHGSKPGMAPLQTGSATVARIAGVGLPLVIVEEEGEYTWREQSAEQGIRTLKVGTDQFATLRRLWKRRKLRPEEPPQSTLQTSIEWDTATGTYELSRVELGLFGKRVWLVHEQRESDDETGTVGIQLRKEW